MKLWRILQRGRYQLLAATVTAFVLLAFPAVQLYVSGGLQNFPVWWDAIPLSNLILFIVFSILVGMLVALQTYEFKHPSCNARKTASASSGGVATVIGLFVPACPACLSLAALLLPAGATLGLVQVILDYGAWLFGASIGLLLVGIYLLGGLEATNE